MKYTRITSIIALLFFLGSCGNTRDLAETLRFSGSKSAVGVDQINFKDLKQMKKGEACTWHLFFIIPIFGDGSIITAAEKAGINNVQLIGQTGFWYGGVVNKNCTVVYGDNPNLNSIINKNKNKDSLPAKKL